MQSRSRALASAFTEDGVPGNPLVQTKDSPEKLRIMTNFMIDSESENVDEEINGALAAGLAPWGPDYSVDMYNKVDSTISDDFRSGAQNATIFSLIIIFLYIFFRFRKVAVRTGCLDCDGARRDCGAGGVLHFGGLLPFTMEIDQAFIAAILTVIGYSINDTVVVFDRIREYVGLYGNKKGEEELMNSALNSTLSRTINTSLDVCGVAHHLHVGR